MDQAIAGHPVKWEVLDKRRSLRNTSGNLLDIHRRPSRAPRPASQCRMHGHWLIPNARRTKKTIRMVGADAYRSCACDCTEPHAAWVCIWGRRRGSGSFYSRTGGGQAGDTGRDAHLLTHVPRPARRPWLSTRWDRPGHSSTRRAVYLAPNCDYPMSTCPLLALSRPSDSGGTRPPQSPFLADARRSNNMLLR
jgi:hypothetical protein